jgi:hypothetical protein
MNQILSKLLGASMPGDSMSRFEYDRMTGEEFEAGLREIEMHPKAFARIFGVQYRTVRKWLKEDGTGIPAWVYVALSLLRTSEAKIAARDAAARMIRIDNLKPQRGEYPYLINGGAALLEDDGNDDD